MDDIIRDFKSECKDLVEQLMTLLEEAEEDFSLRKNLETYGQIVDRMMGGAKSIAITMDDPHSMDKIGSYAEICKLVGYKGSQIEEEGQFYTVVVAFLLDGTEMLQEMINALQTEKEQDIKVLLTVTFLDRLRWISTHFDENVRGTLEVEGITGTSSKTSQEQIDALLEQLGI